MKTPIEEGEPPTYSGIPSNEAVRAVSVRIKTILVPLDFSHASMQALDYAVALAKRFQSVVHLVHVQQADEASIVPGAGHIMRECAEGVAFLHEHLVGVQTKHAKFWPENCHIRTGRAYQEICNLAAELNADLIVLATRGHTGLRHVLLGSTAERVVRFAPCPVLITRQRKRKGRGVAAGLVTSNRELNVRKILAPVDFSSCSLAGAIYAAYLAKKLNATLTLIHVLFPPGPIVTDRVSGEIPRRGETERANARLNMEAFTKLDFLRDIKYETEIRTGYPIDEICDETTRPDIDLLVTSTHGHTGLKHMLLGSVAEHVVRYSECPVLVVPSRLTCATVD